jgi:hypothetical protein
MGVGHKAISRKTDVLVMLPRSICLIGKNVNIGRWRLGRFKRNRLFSGHFNQGRPSAINGLALVLL